MMLRMVAAGESTGKIDEMLEKMADFWDEEIEATLSALTSLLEPILIVVLGVIVGGIVIALFLPIFQMSEVVSGGRKKAEGRRMKDEGRRQRHPKAGNSARTNARDTETHVQPTPDSFLSFCLLPSSFCLLPSFPWPTVPPSRVDDGPADLAWATRAARCSSTRSTRCSSSTTNAAWSTPTPAACVLLGAPRRRSSARPSARLHPAPARVRLTDLAARWQDFLRDGQRIQDECRRPRRRRHAPRHLPRPGEFPAGPAPARRARRHRTPRSPRKPSATPNSSTAPSSRPPTPATSSPTPRAACSTPTPSTSTSAATATLDEILGRHPLEWTAPRDRVRFGADMPAACQRRAAAQPGNRFHRRPGRTPARGDQRHRRRTPTTACACSASATTSPGRVQTRRELENARHELERRVRTPHGRTRPRQRAHPVPRAPAGSRRRPGPPRAGRARTSTSSCARRWRPFAPCSTWNSAACVEHADPESDELMLRAVHGWQPTSTSASPWPRPTPTLPQRLRAGQPRAGGRSRTSREETRFRLLAGHGRRAASSAASPCPSAANLQPFGLLGAHSTPAAPLHARRHLFPAVHRQRAGRRHRAQTLGGDRASGAAGRRAAPTTRRSNSSRA